MEVKKGYKKTEVGVIPEDWSCVAMGDIGKSLIGLTYKPNNVSEHGVLVLRSSNVQKNRLAYEDNVYVNMDLPDRVMVMENDILICVRNGSRQLIGKCALIDETAKGAAFGAFMSVYRTVYPKFVFYQFQGDIIQKQIKEVMGATINQITNKNLASFYIPFPPTKVEKIAIANALSDADALIQSLTRLIEKKRQIKQGAMQSLLNPYENGRLKAGWRFVSYEQAFDFLSTASYSRADLSPGEEYGYIHYGDIHTLWQEFINFECHDVPRISLGKAKKYALIKDGDIVMTDASEDYAGIGKSVEIKSINAKKVIAGLHTFLLRDKSGIFVDGYKGFIQLSRFVKKQFDSLATGLKVYGISKANLKRIEIPLPPKSEQLRVAIILSEINKEITALEAKLAKAQQIKQGMMQNLLTGRVRLI